jgi:uncharacterized protein involved in tellurium resistance
VTIPRDPRQAPARPDLGWLRRRARPPKPAPPPPPVAAHLRQPPPAATPAPEPPRAEPGRSSLDLGPTPEPAPAAPSEPAAPAVGRGGRRPLEVRSARRVSPSGPTRLTAAEPTVTLTRLQSGAGALEIALTRSSSAGDLAMGAVIETTERTEAVVQAYGDTKSAPADARLPLARLKGRDDGETLTFDLRQVRVLRRALVYGYSPSVSMLAWRGVLVLTLYSGARIDVPFDLAPFSGTLALLTIYNVAGELVIRAELDEYHGPPEMVAQAYDHRLPWLDGRRPLP